MSDRIYLLSVLLGDKRKETRAIEWTHHRDDLIDLAMTDENGYVRYLAAKHVSKPDESADTPVLARYRRVKEDAAVLVQSADELNDIRFFRDKPDRFWRHPQIKRLALVNGEEDGKYIADVLRYATRELLPHGSVTLYEMGDVLLQFLGTNFKQTFADFKKRADFSRSPEDMYCLNQTVIELWNVIPDLPKPLSYVLLGCLPEPPHSPVPPRVLDSLDEGQLGHLLSQSDIAQKELRRKIYTESVNNSLRQAAVHSQNFELLDSYISRLVLDPDEPEESSYKKIEELVMLADTCGGATLVQMQAICNLITDPRYPKRWRGMVSNLQSR